MSGPFVCAPLLENCIIMSSWVLQNVQLCVCLAPTVVGLTIMKQALGQHCIARAGAVARPFAEGSQVHSRQGQRHWQAVDLWLGQEEGGKGAGALAQPRC